LFPSTWLISHVEPVEAGSVDVITSPAPSTATHNDADGHDSLNGATADADDAAVAALGDRRGRRNRNVRFPWLRSDNTVGIRGCETAND
jgi:hypothetical protein